MLKKIFSNNYIIPSHYFIFIDQMVVSAGNFLLSIIILRFLGLEAFGIFSFYWLFLLLINGLQTSYIISPMLTNAPKQNHSTVNYFYGGVLIQQLIFTLLISSIIFITLKFLSNFSSIYQTEDNYLQFSLIVIATQFHQFLRRLLFSKNLSFRALLGDFVTYFLLIISLLYLNFLEQFILTNVWWLFLYTFLLGCIINLSIIFTLDYKFKNSYEAIKENWIIGKWLLVTSLSQWFSGNLWLVNAGLILGPYTFGIIRACQTLLNISNIIFQSIENFIPAAVTRKFEFGGIKEMDIYLKKFTIKYLIITSLIVFMIILFSKYLLDFFYGNETANHYQILIYLSLIIPINFLQYPLNYGFRTLAKTKPIFISFLCSTIFALLASKIIITNFKIQGLIFGLYASQIIILFILYFSYYQLKKKIKQN
jgi:O-antigen/teichoic acid export membrane protein